MMNSFIPWKMKWMKKLVPLHPLTFETDSGKGPRSPRIGRYGGAAVLLVAGLAFYAALFAGCGNDDPVITDVEQKSEDIPGFDFALPCPLTGFSQEYLTATNVSRDGIPPIDSPSFALAKGASWLNDDDRVLGVVLGGMPLALPIRIMVWHEVVNVSTPAGMTTVTYCPLTFSGISFDLEDAFPGQSQSVGVSGLLYNSNLVLYDRRTDSLWPQMSGSAHGGPSAGKCLDMIPTMDTTIRFWRTLYPNTAILERPKDSPYTNKYDVNPYEEYWNNENVIFPVPRPLDNRLKNKARVLGVIADTGARAFPLLDVPVVNDSLPGVPFVVFNRMLEKTMVAYKAWVVDGERLVFSFKENVAGAPVYTDDQTGSTWNFKGECINGPLAGSALERMPSYLTFYFAWSSYFPNTSIYGAD